MNNLNFYDSDLNSENEEAKFESDHEPPKDRVHDKKSIYKSKELKIYKTIIQVNRYYFSIPNKTALGGKRRTQTSKIR